MKQTIKKTVALLLSLIMLLSVSVISIGAVENSVVSPANAKNGDLIRNVDFEDAEHISYARLNALGGGDNQGSTGLAEESTQTAKGSSISIKTTTGNSSTSRGIVGELKGITMGAGAVYTVDFAIGGTFETGYAAYVDFKMSDGELRGSAFMTASKTPYKNYFVRESGGADGATTVAANNYWYFEPGENNATPASTAKQRLTPKVAEIEGVKYLYYRMVVDYDAKTITPYILSYDDTFVCATEATVEDCSFPEGNLTIALLTKTKNNNAVIFDDISIYKGNLQKATDVSVTVDGTTETKVITGYEYELTTLKKIGYVFAGWKVNGAETATPAGTVIPTEGLTTLEAVFEKTMSEVFVQFGNKTATTVDMRIVGVLDSINYKSIGYKISIKKAGTVIYSNDSFELTAVYTSLTAKYGAEAITLESLGYGNSGGYLTALTVQNIPTGNVGIIVELTPYQKDTAGNKIDGEIIVIDFDDVWAKAQ